MPADAVSGPLGKIFISARLDEADMLEIRCNDNGCGIKEEDMGNLFNHFLQRKIRAKEPGWDFISYTVRLKIWEEPLKWKAKKEKEPALP